MSRPRFEVADVVRQYEGQYRRGHTPSPAQAKVLRNIARCRTAELGGHVDRCDTCSHARISYNSCRDRHCPKCQGAQREEWLEKRLARLLPTSSFHIVFTLPHELNPLVLRNRRLLYGLLFRAASQTLLQIGRDPKHLGAEIGISAVLHTWGQNLLLHPHLHCVVTAGGLSSDEREWKPTRPGFFAPVAVLSKLFRGKFLAALQTLGAKGAIRYPRSEPELCEATRWKAFVDGLYDKKWVVYSKPPFGGAEHVFRYLGRYTHRVAISNYRLVSVAGGKVAFRYRDYARGSRDRTMTLDAVEFLRRFLLHVLPRGFVRIRHYGLYAPSNVGTKLAIAARLLGKEAIDEVSPEESDHRSWWERLRDRSGVDVMACPCCGSGRLVRSEIIARADHADGARASPEAG